MSNSGRLNSIIEMLEKEPNDLFLNYALALEYAATSDKLLLAEKQLKLVLGLDPNYIPAYYQLGQLFTTLQRTSEALDYYKVGLEKAKEQRNNKAINEIGEAIFMIED